MECSEPEQQEIDLPRERTTILSRLHDEPASPELQQYLDRLREGSSDWNSSTYIQGLEIFSSVCGQKRNVYYGENTLKGLLDMNTFVRRWNKRYPQQSITLWDQDIRRQCPPDWVSTLKNGDWVLAYQGEAPLSQGLNNLLKGPATLDCGMFAQLTQWMAIRYMIGDEWFSKLFSFGRGDFVLTQTWSESLRETKGNLLYPLYDAHSRESTSSVIWTWNIRNFAGYDAKHPGGGGRLQNVTQIGDKWIIFNSDSSRTIVSRPELGRKMLQDYNAPQDEFDEEKLHFFKAVPDFIHLHYGQDNGTLYREAKERAHHTLSETEWEETKPERAKKSFSMNFNLQRLLNCLQEAKKAFAIPDQATHGSVLSRAESMKTQYTKSVYGFGRSWILGG